MKKFSLLLGVIILSLVSLNLVVADTGGYGSCPMGGMMYGTYGSGFMVLGWLTYLLVIVLIIATIYWLIKSANRKR